MVMKPGKRWAARRREDGSWELVPPQPKPKMKLTTEAKPKPPQPDDPRDSYSRGVGGPWVA